MRAALGVIPAGGNDAARSLGLPAGDPLAAAALLAGCGGGRPTWPRSPGGPT